MSFGLIVLQHGDDAITLPFKDIKKKISTKNLIPVADIKKTQCCFKSCTCALYNVAHRRFPKMDNLFMWYKK